MQWCGQVTIEFLCQGERIIAVVIDGTIETPRVDSDALELAAKALRDAAELKAFASKLAATEQEVDSTQREDDETVPRRMHGWDQPKAIHGRSRPAQLASGYG